MVLAALDGVLTCIAFFVITRHMVETKAAEKDIKSLTTLAIIMASAYAFIVLLSAFGIGAVGCIEGILQVLVAGIVSAAIAYYTYKAVHAKNWDSAKTYVDLNLITTVASTLVMMGGFFHGMMGGAPCIGMLLSALAFVIVAVLLGLTRKDIGKESSGSAKSLSIVTMIVAGLAALTFIIDFV